MAQIRNNGTFTTTDIGEGNSDAQTQFRDNDDFSVDSFDDNPISVDLPKNVGIAFIKSSDSPKDWATVSLKGNRTSTIYADNISSNLTFAASGDVYIGYKASNVTGNVPVLNTNPSANGDLYVKGFIYGNFNNTRLQGRTRFGLNTIEIDGDNNSITGIGQLTANVGNITSITGITTITPATNLNVNGGLVVSGVSTVGIASTSNLTSNSTFSFELTSNTNLRIRVRGTDGVIRSANLTLS
jgi:hypothetical protein